MGLFSFFKKKTEPAVNVSITVSKSPAGYNETKQRASGELSVLSLDGYVSPSGGFVNFGRFRVIGKNTATGRQNTKIIEAKDETAAVAQAEAGGLAGPFTITVESTQEPTDRQVDYALDLGASLPFGACSEDVSAIISRITDDDEEGPLEAFAEFAHAIGVRFSRCIGKQALYYATFSGAGERDKTALYVYAVHVSLTGGEIGNLLISPLRDTFYEFADAALSDAALMKSINGRSGIDLTAPNKNTAAYKAAAQFIRERCGIKK
jgi:hypothetical protein